MHGMKTCSALKAQLRLKKDVIAARENPRARRPMPKPPKIVLDIRNCGCASNIEGTTRKLRGQSTCANYQTVTDLPSQYQTRSTYSCCPPIPLSIVSPGISCFFHLFDLLEHPRACWYSKLCSASLWSAGAHFSGIGMTRRALFSGLLKWEQMQRGFRELLRLWRPVASGYEGYAGDERQAVVSWNRGERELRLQVASDPGYLKRNECG